MNQNANVDPDVEQFLESIKVEEDELCTTIVTVPLFADTFGENAHIYYAELICKFEYQHNNGILNLTFIF